MFLIFFDTAFKFTDDMIMEMDEYMNKYHVITFRKSNSKEVFYNLKISTTLSKKYEEEMTYNIFNIICSELEGGRKVLDLRPFITEKSIQIQDQHAQENVNV